MHIFQAWKNYLDPDQEMELVYGQKKKIFRFSRQYTNSIPWIKIKIIFSCLENVRNQFPAYVCFQGENRNFFEFRVNK